MAKTVKRYYVGPHRPGVDVTLQTDKGPTRVVAAVYGEPLEVRAAEAKHLDERIWSETDPGKSSGDTSPAKDEKPAETDGGQSEDGDR